MPDNPRWSRSQQIQRFAQLFALSGFAIVQPVLDLVGSEPTFLVAHGMSRSDILVYTLALLAAPAAGLFLIQLLVGTASSRAGLYAQASLIGGLAGLTVAPTLDLRIRWFLVIVGVVAVLVGFLYLRSSHFRTGLTWLAVAPLVFAAYFLVVSPASVLMSNDQSVEVADPAARVTTDVFVVIFDEFALPTILNEDGTINRERFPNFGRLADIATWYPTATTVHPHTQVAIPAILSGTHPAPRTVATSIAFPHSIFTLLGASHRINAVEPITNVCPPRLCVPDGASDSLWTDTAIVYLHRLLPQGLTSRWLPSIDDRWANFGTAGATSLSTQDRGSTFVDWINAIQPNADPSLHLIHTLLPHTPWEYLPTGQRYENTFFGGLFEEGPGGYWRDGAEYTTQGRQRVLLQVGYVDLLVGQLLDRLQQTGHLESSMLVVTADHGFAFEPGLSRRGLESEAAAASLLSVPLFIKYPGSVVGDVDHRRVQSVDVLPTIAASLGIDPGWDFDGQSLAAPHGSIQPPIVLSGDGSKETQPDRAHLVKSLAAEIAELFGDGSDQFDLYGFGPHRHLLGSTPTTTLTGSATAEISGLGRFRSVDPDSNHLPTRVTGTIDVAGQITNLALTVNGTIGAIGTSYFDPDSGIWRFSLFIAPDFLTSGCLDIGLLLVRDDFQMERVDTGPAPSCP